MPATLQVLLLRHGQTDSNADGVLQGHLPTPLNALGHTQAARLAARLATFEPAIDVLVTSDLRRAVETVAPIEQVLGLGAEHDRAWRERAFGSFEGRTVGDTESWRAATGTIDPPGAEPLDALQARVALALTDLARRHHERRCVAVVTHGGVMRTVLRLLIDGGLPLDEGRELLEAGPILNGSILHLAGMRSRGTATTVWNLIRVNDVDHLQESDITAPGAG